MQAAVCWQFILEVLISAEKVSKPQRVIDPIILSSVHFSSIYQSSCQCLWKDESPSFKATAQKINCCFWAAARRIGCVLGWVPSQALSSNHDQTGGIRGVNGCFPWLCLMLCVREQIWYLYGYRWLPAFFGSGPKRAPEHRTWPFDYTWPTCLLF